MRPGPLNGGRGRNRPPSMTIEERDLWMTAKGAPKDMIMVPTEEYRRLCETVILERQTRMGHESGLKGLMFLLDEYFKTEPDLGNAIAAALFDARRFKPATESAITSLKATKERLSKAIIYSADIGLNSFSADFLRVSNELGETIKALEAVAAERRDRRAHIELLERSAGNRPAAPQSQPEPPKP